MKIKRIFYHILITALIIGFSGCSNKKKELSEVEIKESIEEQVSIAKEYLSEGKKTQAISLLEDLQSQYPEDVTVLEALGFAYMDCGDASLSAFYFEQINKHDPHHYEHRIFCAQAYMAAKMYEEACRNYEAYLEHFPNDRITWKVLGKAYELSKKDSEALEAYLRAEELTKIASEEEDALKIADLYERLGNFQEAKTWNHLALTQNPQSVGALNSLLRLEIKSESWEEARKHLSLLEQKPEELQDKGLMELGKKILCSSNPGEMHKQIINQEELEKKKAIVDGFKGYVREGNRLRANKDFSQSIQYYKKALQINSQAGFLWDSLCQAYMGVKDYDNAEKAGREAINRQRDKLAYTFNYLKAIKAKGEVDKLISELNKAKVRFPQNADITLTLAKTYHLMVNNPKQAKPYYIEFLKQSSPNGQTKRVEELIKQI